MKVEIVRADPTGNTTILVTSPVPSIERRRVASAVMGLFGGWAEQMGFVTESENAPPRLDMMGGEFCGNASLSLTAYLAERSGLSEAETGLSVSGAPDAVRCAVRRNGAYWEGSVSMPAPESVTQERYSLAGEERVFWTVRLPGITHVIVPARSFDRESAERASREWSRRSAAQAFGVLLFDESENSMQPLVFVPEAGSSVWEHGCASGTAAVGAFLAVRDGGSAELDLRQPGGVIGVTARAEGESVTRLAITGRVRLMGKTTVEV